VIARSFSVVLTHLKKAISPSDNENYFSIVFCKAVRGLPGAK
jgi:hypothetical protein